MSNVLGNHRTVEAADGHAGIQQVVVVIPAHNEEQRLGRCLAAVCHAMNVLQSAEPGIQVLCVLVLDACTDDSQRAADAVVAGDARFASIDSHFRSVGAARQLGVSEGLLRLRASSALPSASTWVASTDADSVVPEHWLLTQVQMAQDGADAVLGTVEPEPSGADPAILRLWHGRHSLTENHSHIHGANLGARASAYVVSGGFPALETHEDRILVTEMRQRGYRVVATDRIRVITSSRTEGRAPEGFGAYLRSLAEPGSTTH